MSDITSNECLTNRTRDGVVVMAVKDKTKDGKSVKTYISKHLGLSDAELIRELINSMPALFDSPIGTYGTDKQYQRGTEALRKGYISIEDYETEDTIIIQIFVERLRRVLRNHPKLKPSCEKYVNQLIPVSTSSISKDESMFVYGILLAVIQEDTGQKTITQPVSDIKTYPLDMRLSINVKSTAGFIPRADLFEAIKVEHPESFVLSKVVKGKLMVDRTNKKGTVIIDLW